MDALTQQIAEQLTTDMIPDGIWKTVALEIGTVNLIRVLCIINGDDIYIPKPNRILTPARDACILKEFNGYNYAQLATKYGLTTAYIKRVCKKAQGAPI